MAASIEDMMELSDDGKTLINVNNIAIKYGAFTIPNSVTKIGYNAFDGCISLSNITIPSSVTNIGGWAFKGCASLSSITIPNLVTQIGYSAFVGCLNLSSITIPNSVTNICGGAFGYCSSLHSITIPNSVTQIGIEAFIACINLSSITLPDSVIQIGDYAFDGCTSLANIIIDSDDDNEIARITALLPEELRSKVITEHQVANHFRPNDGGWAIHSLFWQSAKTAAKLKDIEGIANESAEAIEAASQFT